MVAEDMPDESIRPGESDNEQPSPKAVRPTKKQRELLVFIDTFIKEHGYSPSYREIMNGCSYTSVATVALHIGSLTQRGHLRKRDHSARSLELTQPIEPDDETDGTSAEKKELTQEDKNQLWLKHKVDKVFRSMETADTVAPTAVAELQAITHSLTLLGLDELAQNYQGRMAALHERLTAAGTDSI
jgi:hypothetical protein